MTLTPLHFYEMGSRDVSWWLLAWLGLIWCEVSFTRAEFMSEYAAAVFRCQLKSERNERSNPRPSAGYISSTVFQGLHSPKDFYITPGYEHRTRPRRCDPLYLSMPSTYEAGSCRRWISAPFIRVLMTDKDHIGSRKNRSRLSSRQTCLLPLTRNMYRL